MFVTGIPGEKVDWTVGQAGGPVDIHPGVVFNSNEAFTQTGRYSPVATVIVERTSLAGEKYLDVQEGVPTRFLFPRTEACERIDGASDIAGILPRPLLQKLAGEAMAARKAFIVGRSAASTVASLAAELDAETA